jgi:hypothetical protein
MTNQEELLTFDEEFDYTPLPTTNAPRKFLINRNSLHIHKFRPVPNDADIKQCRMCGVIRQKFDKLLMNDKPNNYITHCETDRLHFINGKSNGLLVDFKTRKELADEIVQPTVFLSSESKLEKWKEMIIKMQRTRKYKILVTFYRYFIWKRREAVNNWKKIINKIKLKEINPGWFATNTPVIQSQVRCKIEKDYEGRIVLEGKRINWLLSTYRNIEHDFIKVVPYYKRRNRYIEDIK